MVDLEKKPQVRIYEFYGKIQELKHEIGQKNAAIKLMEKNNEDLQKKIKYGENMKMEWKNKYENKCMEDALRSKFIFIVVVIVGVVLGFFMTVF